MKSSLRLLLSAATAVFALLSAARGGVVQANFKALTRTTSALVGITTTGDIQQSTDGGATFSTKRTAGPVGLYSLNASGNLVVAVGDAGYIVRSTDGGTTWLETTSPSFVGGLYGVASSNGTTWVAVGTTFSNKVTELWSADSGATWTSGSIAAQPSGTLKSVVYDASQARWTAVGSDGLGGDRIITSTDGKNWTAENSLGTRALTSVATDGLGHVVAVGEAGTLATSSNGGLVFSLDANSGLVSEDLNTVVYSSVSGWTAGGQDLVQVNYTLGGGATVASAPVSGGGDINTLVVDASGQVVVSGGNLAGYQTITFAGPGNQTLNASPVILLATASSGLPISFSVLSGPAGIVAGNKLTLTGVGQVTVQAAQTGGITGGISYNAAAPVTRTLTVTHPVATVVLGNLTATYDNTPKSATATTTPAGLNVAYTYGGSPTAPTNAGSYAVVATVLDANYQGTASGTLVISPADQTITFAALPDIPFTTTPLTLVATASSKLDVAFALVSGPATLANGSLTLTGTGTVTVGASQAGNNNYNAAPSVLRSFNVTGNFEAWRVANFDATELKNASISGPNAIYGQDGLSNLLKYALGLPAKPNATTGLPVLSTSGSNWTYTYTHPAGITDVTYVVEVSTDLVAWTTAGVVGPTQQTSIAGVETWEATYPQASAANVFFRLKINY